MEIRTMLWFPNSEQWSLENLEKLLFIFHTKLKGFVSMEYIGRGDLTVWTMERLNHTLLMTLWVLLIITFFQEWTSTILFYKYSYYLIFAHVVLFTCCIWFCNLNYKIFKDREHLIYLFSCCDICYSSVWGNEWTKGYDV